MKLPGTPSPAAITPAASGRDCPSAPTAAGGFPNTQWSLVADVRSGSDTAARDALEALCRAYWFPLYAYVRRHGRTHHEAEDCTQEFFARLLAAGGMARARPERGRFRTFLLCSMRNFLTNEWRHDHAAKRGHGLPTASLDTREADDRFIREPVDPALTPEEAFDRAWAHEMLQRATASLRSEYEGSGRSRQFVALVPHLWRGLGEAAIAATADALGVSVPTLRVALHRLRRRYGEHLRTVVAETVADPSELDAELRHLMEAFQHRG